MKLFKTIAAVALLVFSTSIMAQGQGGNRRSSSERAKTETENIVKALALTPEQAAKVLEINLKYATKDSIRFAEMRASGATMDREAMMKTRTEQAAAQAVEVKAVMTDDQKVKYEAFIKEREAERAARQNGQGGRQGGQSGQRPQ
jgi:protein CpxP